MRRYTITVYKRLHEGGGEVYGAKTFDGNLDRTCKRLIKLFGLNASVRRIGPGGYEIAGGKAELWVR